MLLSFCSLASGSSGNCQLVGSERTKLLVDAGMSGRYIKTSLENINVDINEVSGILLTHEHTDHISGLGVLMRRHKLPLYITSKTWSAVKDKIGQVDASLVHVYDKIDGLEIGDLWVESVSVKHDAIDPLCYTFTKGNSKMGIATDLGTIDNAVIDTFKTCDLVMVESNHDEMMLKTGGYPYALKQRILSDSGHLSNEDAGYISRELIAYGKTKHLLLAHLSKENNFPDLAYETVRSILEADGIQVGKDIVLDLTYRDRVGKLYQLKK
ncbi:MBL fold metallo-hydrolase [Fusibacter sp. JL298sf-3]